MKLVQPKQSMPARLCRVFRLLRRDKQCRRGGSDARPTRSTVSTDRRQAGNDAGRKIRRENEGSQVQSRSRRSLHRRDGVAAEIRSHRGRADQSKLRPEVGKVLSDLSERVKVGQRQSGVRHLRQDQQGRGLSVASGEPGFRHRQDPEKHQTAAVGPARAFEFSAGPPKRFSLPTTWACPCQTASTAMPSRSKKLTDAVLQGAESINTHKDGGLWLTEEKQMLSGLAHGRLPPHAAVRQGRSRRRGSDSRGRPRTILSPDRAGPLDRNHQAFRLRSGREHRGRLPMPVRRPEPDVSRDRQVSDRRRRAKEAVRGVVRPRRLPHHQGFAEGHRARHALYGFRRRQVAAQGDYRRPWLGRFRPTRPCSERSSRSRSPIPTPTTTSFAGSRSSVGPMLAIIWNSRAFSRPTPFPWTN